MESKQVLPDVLPGKANIMPNPFSSKMSGGADTRPEQVMPGFNGESVSPGKAIFMGGKRRTRRHNNKRRGGKRSTGKRSTGKRSTGKRSGGTSKRNKNIMRGGSFKPVNLRIGENIYTFLFSTNVSKFMYLQYGDAKAKPGMYAIPFDWAQFVVGGKRKVSMPIDYLKAVRVGEESQNGVFELFTSEISKEILEPSVESIFNNSSSSAHSKEHLSVDDFNELLEILSTHDLDEHPLEDLFGTRAIHLDNINNK